MHKKGAKRIALSCAALLALSSGGTVLAAEATAVPISAALGTGLSYEFTGADAGKAGYAEGTISLSSATDAAYHLYWSNNTGALSGYYPIATLEVGAGKTETFSFGYHTAILADATKVIAVNTSVTDYPSVAAAAAVFDIPANKRLGYSSKDALYTFNSFSDIHIDEEHFGDTPAYW